MIQLAWRFLLFQKQSNLALWYRARTADSRIGTRKTMIAAVLRDRSQRVFARPENVHRIRHDGRYFQIEAIHLCEPSPQRTPLIYQAGSIF